MIPWELTIRKGSNGYKISWKEENEYSPLGYIEKEEYVQEEEGAEESEAEANAAVDLIYKLMDHFSVYGSKHNRVRVAVNKEHGSNYECKGCDVCKGALAK